MKSRDLPGVVKAKFGVGSPLRVKTLTPATLLHEKHNPTWPVSSSPSAPQPAHSILRRMSQNFYFKSRIPDPDPRLTGGLGQQ